MMRIGYLMFKCLLSPACYCSVASPGSEQSREVIGRSLHVVPSPSTSLGPPPPASSMNQGTLGALLGALLGGLCASVPRHRPRHEPAFPAASLADFTAETASYLPSHIRPFGSIQQWKCWLRIYLIFNGELPLQCLTRPSEELDQSKVHGTNIVILVVDPFVISV